MKWQKYHDKDIDREITDVEFNMGDRLLVYLVQDNPIYGELIKTRVDAVAYILSSIE